MNLVRGMAERFSCKKAMTLTEMLIILAIIALIGGILIPSFQKARAKTRMAICLHNLRILRAAADNYSMFLVVPDTVEVSVDTLLKANYLLERMKCPEGDAGYNPFIIKDGPVCPSAAEFPDHKLKN